MKNTIVIILAIFSLFFAGCVSGNFIEKTNDDNKNSSDVNDEDIVNKDLSFSDRITAILGKEPDDYNYTKQYDNWFDMYCSMAFNNGVYSDSVYYVAYIDNDEIPEFITYKDNYVIWTWNGNEKEQSIGVKMAYSEKSGKLLSVEEKEDAMYLIGYLYDRGNLQQDIIVKENSDGENNILGCKFNQASYELINDFINLKDVVYLSYDNCYSQEEIINILKNGHNSSYSHRYEVVYEDVSWQEAQELCKKNGGYLAVITSNEELQKIMEYIPNKDKLSVLYIGCSGSYREERWILKDDYTIEVGGGKIYVPEFDNNSIFQNIGIDYQREKMEYGFLVYGVSDINTDGEKQAKMYLGPNNMIENNKTLSGKIGYICEYDE